MVARKEGIDLQELENDKKKHLEEQQMLNNQQDNTKLEQNPKNNIQGDKKQEVKSIGTQTGGEGLTDNTLIPISYDKGKNKKEKQNPKIETKPFAGYEDFQDCVNKNKDKGDAEAYCATIMRKVEGK